MESDFISMGRRDIWGGSIAWGLLREDVQRHLYVIGQTGTGKSTLLTEIMMQDVYAGEGCAFIDPHGDAARSLLDRIPSWRIDDVVLIEPGDLAHPVSINPFFQVPVDDRPLIASNTVATFKHLWRDSWGPRLEYLLYNSVAALLDAPDHLRPTLLSIPRLYVDEGYREAVVAHITDPQVRQFWTQEYVRWGERFLSEVISPVQNKVGALVAAPALRNILGQWRPKIDFSAIIKERKIVIANLAKGEIGEDKANMIGSFLVAGIQAAAMRQSRIAIADRPDFHLIIDEFHNFGTDAFASILSESRKMKLSLCLAHQYLAQNPPDIQDAIFGNVGSIVAFRVGAEDASRLAAELGEYPPDVLRRLDQGRVCARLLVSGAPRTAFLGEVACTPGVEGGKASTIRAQSQQRYARDRAEVEHKISRWLCSAHKQEPLIARKRR